MVTTLLGKLDCTEHRATDATYIPHAAIWTQSDAMCAFTCHVTHSFTSQLCARSHVNAFNTQDHVQQPFHDMLPYPAFSLRISHDDIPRLRDILRYAVRMVSWPSLVQC
jgi:hypothetical protein